MRSNAALQCKITDLAPFVIIRGGLVFWADLVGSKYIYERLLTWEKSFGGFFKPSRFLKERGIANAKLVNLFSAFFCRSLVHSTDYYLSVIFSEHTNKHFSSLKFLHSNN